MKTILKNCWLMMIGWSLILNSHRTIATVIAVSACILLILSLKEVNYWRVSSVCMFLYAGCLMTMLAGGIPYYFPELYIFLTAVCLDAALMHEHLQELNKKRLIGLILVIVSCLAVLAILIVIVPEESYLLFTKKNLFRMGGLIFLPYLIPALTVLLYRVYREAHTGHEKRITV